VRLSTSSSSSFFSFKKSKAETALLPHTSGSVSALDIVKEKSPKEKNGKKSKIAKHLDHENRKNLKKRKKSGFSNIARKSETNSDRLTDEIAMETTQLGIHTLSGRIPKNPLQTEYSSS
jgi:hypothetical protein